MKPSETFQIEKDDSGAVTKISCLDINGSEITLAAIFSDHHSMRVTDISRKLGNKDRAYVMHSEITNEYGKTEYIPDAALVQFELVASPEQIVAAFKDSGIKAPIITRSPLEIMSGLMKGCLK